MQFRHQDAQALTTITPLVFAVDREVPASVVPESTTGLWRRAGAILTSPTALAEVCFESELHAQPEIKVVVTINIARYLRTERDYPLWWLSRYG